MGSELPRTADLVGQETALRAFRAALTGDRVAGTYLLYGPRGVGRGLGAELFGCALLCESPSGAEPCRRCPSCHLNAAGTHGDFLCVSSAAGPFFKDDGEAARSSLQGFVRAAWWAGRDNPRRTLPVRTLRRLQDFLGLASVAGGRKVVVIDAMEQVEEEGTASLLKSLEEPPPGTTFLLLAESPDGVIDTILSRCQRIRFRPLEPDVVRSLLAREGGDEFAGLEPRRLDLLVRIGQGSVGRALAALREGVQGEPYDAVTALLAGERAASEETAVAWVTARRDLLSQRERARHLLTLILLVLRDEAGRRLAADRLGDALAAVRGGFESIKSNVGPELAVRSLWVRLGRSLA